MKIYSMTATFGKLNQQILTLKPGLNIIEAPNEWGKSTWCAFLISMLYGIDTRSKTTRSQLADKERYQPWSGAAMEGSIDLNWNGRDITIQRRSKGRVPMGEFRAFETKTGLNVSELTADNCGQQLLGVEKDVFTRAGFLRFTDLPVTEDEQLRSRLNALVTTGDESGNAQLLEQKLKELKNRCRYNRTGLLPQARQRKEELEQQLEDMKVLDNQYRQADKRIRELEQHIRKLENHKAALRHSSFLSGTAMLREAQTEKDRTQRYVDKLQKQIELLPSRESAMKQLQELQELQKDLEAIRMEEQMLPKPPSLPVAPRGFEGCTAREAVIQAQQHRNEIEALPPRFTLGAPLLLILGIFLLFFGVFLYRYHQPVWSLVACVMGIVYLVFSFILSASNKQRKEQYKSRLLELTQRYGSQSPVHWQEVANQYLQQWQEFTGSEDQISTQWNELNQRKEALLSKIMTATRTMGLTGGMEYWQNAINVWDEYAEARCTLRQADKNLRYLQNVVTNAPPPIERDDLTFSEEETLRLLSDASYELKQLLTKRGQFQGMLESMGQREALERESQALDQRILELEQYYAASELALKTLEQAKAQLQFRFAPRISQIAQELLTQLTNGRYNRLTLSEDFSLQASTEGETVLRSRLWRSDGTGDQLYLALRLAVARELTPDAPLVLDDAMIRFDRDRLRAALEILKLEAQRKQVIIFTCHGRENELLNS